MKSALRTGSKITHLLCNVLLALLLDDRHGILLEHAHSLALPFRLPGFPHVSATAPGPVIAIITVLVPAVAIVIFRITSGVAARVEHVIIAVIAIPVSISVSVAAVAVVTWPVPSVTVVVVVGISASRAIVAVVALVAVAVVAPVVSRPPGRIVFVVRVVRLVFPRPTISAG